MDCVAAKCLKTLLALGCLARCRARCVVLLFAIFIFISEVFSGGAVRAQTKPPSGIAGTQQLSGLLASGLFTPAELDLIWENRSRLHGSLTEFVSSLPEIADRYPILVRVSQLLAYVGHFVVLKGPPAKRAETFYLGYQIAERARELEPSRVEGHYWYAVNLAGFAAAEGAFTLWRHGGRVLEALDIALGIQPQYFFGGPLRTRGILLLKMPSVPLSIGNKSQGLADLKEAVQLSPDVRLNRLALAEALAFGGQFDLARKELVRLRSVPQLMGSVEEAQVLNRVAEIERRAKP